MTSPEELEGAVNETVPANPPNGVIVMVELFEVPPARTVM